MTAASSTFRRILVLGGARSGKSAFAEELALRLGGAVLYVATATACDAEMAERIRRHRERRPAEWRTLEEPVRVADAAAEALDAARTVLLEDLTLWLSNLLVSPDYGQEPDLLDAQAAEQAVVDGLQQLLHLPANLVVVSNEVGMGLVPSHPLGRYFRDALGRVNQAAAARADEVYLLVAGVPTRLKPAGTR